MEQQRSRSPARKRPLIWLVIGTVFLIVTIIGTNAIFLANLRQRALESAEADLERHSLTLAEQADRSLKALDLVLSSVGDYLSRKDVNDAQSYRGGVIDYDTYVFLKEKITGMPQVDAVTMIEFKGQAPQFFPLLADPQGRCLGSRLL